MEDVVTEDTNQTFVTPGDIEMLSSILGVFIGQVIEMVSESMVASANMSSMPSCRREDFKGEPSPRSKTLSMTCWKAALACGRIKTMVHSKDWGWDLGWSLEI